MKKPLHIFILFSLFMAACSPNGLNTQEKIEINDIQGCSHISPYLGQQVKDIIGVVTHKFSNGFTMQTTISDELDCSSEAIFVFTKEYPAVMIADLVSVDGVVDEFTDGNPEDHNLSQTEITKSHYKVIKTATTLPLPIILDDLISKMPLEIIENDKMSDFDLNEDGLDFFESLESMLVQLNTGRVVSPRNNYNEITILPELLVEKNKISAEGALLNSQTDDNPEKIMIKLPTQFDYAVNIGDQLSSPITGIMDYSYGNYKLLAFSPVEIKTDQLVVEPFMPKSNELTLATYNLENLSPLDENKKFSVISKQIVTALLSPDVLVLNEVLDSSGTADDGVVNADKTVVRLIEAIIKAGGPEYSHSDSPPNNNQDGGIEGGNIRTVLLYRKDRQIELDQSNASIKKINLIDGKILFSQNPILVGENSPVFNGTRKPKIWLLTKNGRQFIVAGVHLTSQGANSPDWGSQQPPAKPEEGKRIEEARMIYDQLSEILAFDPSIPIFIAGDMNALPWSATLMTLTQDLFINTAFFSAPTESYTYIFEGNAQQLDYLLVNQNLANNILQARFVHVNTIQDHSNSISDHDPVIIEYKFDQ